MDPASGGQPINQTKGHRRDRQQHQRHRHRRRRLVRMDVVRVEPRLAGEDEEDEPEHVERGEEGGHQPDDGEDLARS